jgi:phosphoglucosamine mutase
MGVFFGTDGIRGVAGEPPLDSDDIYRIGYCLTRWLGAAHPRPRLLIGRDTRASGPWIEKLLCGAIEAAGGVASVCGVVSTPAVALLTQRAAAQAGIMISASHNPYQDNGIKIFSSEGMKFSDIVEEELEKKILACTLRGPDGSGRDPGAVPFQLAVQSDYLGLYTGYLRSCLAPGFSLAGMRVVVDCANGSLSQIAPPFFAGLGAEVHAIHCRPDGRNINLNAGALHLDSLQEEVRQQRADIGIAFDGDADRAMFVDSEGRVHDGDDVLYLLARYSGSGDTPEVVVGTVMANLGLEAALEKIGCRLVRTAVGDRYVLEEMLRLDAAIGGEQSGHVILARFCRTGDGLLTALKVLEILGRQHDGFAALCSPVQRFPQVLLNVKVREKIPFENIPGLRRLEQTCKEKLGNLSRILLRYSGTEKLARVMVEGQERAVVEECAQVLADLFTSKLH